MGRVPPVRVPDGTLEDCRVVEERDVAVVVAGGQEVVLTGSNFGEDASNVVVYFGSLNAEVLSVSDSEIAIRTPRGPIQGGAVDIAVATPSGVAEAADAYTYEMGALYHENEVGYIVATNYWNSCYGGADGDEGSPTQGKRRLGRRKKADDEG